MLLEGRGQDAHAGAFDIARHHSSAAFNPIRLEENLGEVL
jgi:hypothetical protein